MLTPLQIGIYTAIFIGYLITIYIIGAIINSFIHIKVTRKAPFTELFYGAIFIVLITAIISTRGFTVYIGLTTLFIFLYFKFRVKLNQPNQFHFHPHFYNILIIIGAGLFFFALNLTLYLSSKGQTEIPHEDYLFYSKLANNLFHGFEGLDYNSYTLGIINYKKLMPYHYFELWLAVPAILVTNNPVWSLLLIAYPLLFTITFLGILTLTTHFISSWPLRILSSLMLFMLGGWQFDFMHEFLARNYTGFFTDTTIFSQFGKKYGIIYISILYSFIKYIERKPILFLLGLTIAAYFYPTLMPGVALYYIYILLLKILKTKKINWFVAIQLLTILFPIIFYTINKLVFNNSEPTTLTVNHFKLQYGSGAWFVYIFLLSFGILIPFLVKSLKTLLVNYRSLFTITLFSLSTGFLLSITIPLQRDQIQLFSNTLPLFIILMYIVFLSLLKQKTTIVLLLLGIISSYTFFNNYKKQLDFNRTVDQVTPYNLKSDLEAIIEKYDKNTWYGFYWDQNKIKKLDKYSNLFLSSNFGFLKIHGFMNAINLSNLPNEQKIWLYDEPFQRTPYNMNYHTSLESFLEIKSIAFTIDSLNQVNYIK